MNQNPYEPVATNNRDGTGVSAWRLVLSVLLLVLTISVGISGVIASSIDYPRATGTRRYATYDTESYFFGTSVDPRLMKRISLVVVPIGLLASFLLLRPVLIRKPSSCEKNANATG